MAESSRHVLSRLTEVRQLCREPIKGTKNKLDEVAPACEGDDENSNPTKSFPFLKRGQGLTQKFGFNPSKFRINNLPKYKYAIKRQSSGVKKVQPPAQVPATEVESTKVSIRSKKEISDDESTANEIELQVKNVEISSNDTSDEEHINEEALAQAKLRLFEMLENQADRSSFDANWSSVSELVRLSAEDDEDNQEESTFGTFARQLQAKPDTSPKQQKKLVRFDSNVAVQLEETIDSNDPTLEESNWDSQLSGGNQNNTSIDSAPVRQTIEQQTGILKQRLQEFDRELEKIQQQNAMLIKLKQEHELERIKLEQEREDMRDEFNNEKMQQEMYLHDERMKIVTERQELEKAKKKLSVPNRSEREEISKLNAKVQELEKELKDKEQSHVAAQGRLRGQIRVLEKDNKELSFEVTELKKANKKLELDNVRLSRDRNTNILTSINRNLSKLAEKKVEPPPKQEKQLLSHPALSKRKPTSKKPKDPSPVRPIIDSSSTESDTESENQQSEPKETQLVPKFSKREINLPDGSKEIRYPNGNLKTISADKLMIKTIFYNNDIKETDITGGFVKYYYAATNTWHTEYIDGLEILEFPDGKTERRYKNGKIETQFPGDIMQIQNPGDPNVSEKWIFPDGRTVLIAPNSDRTILLPNGQKEIHTSEHKRREFPDGTVKILYPDGSQETRYSNGRVRIKDAKGQLIKDEVTS